jgi:hypothetical protein
MGGAAHLRRYLAAITLLDNNVKSLIKSELLENHKFLTKGTQSYRVVNKQREACACQANQ